MKKLLFAFCLMALLAFTGCSTMGGGNEVDPGIDPATSGAIGRYWDFDDVLIPVTMKLNKEKSMIFTTEGHRGGLLVFEDNLELTSLVNFFNVNMSKDNWLHKAAFKYPNVALFYAKPDKTCVIHITESTFSTVVHIWVAPTAGGR